MVFNLAEVLCDHVPYSDGTVRDTFYYFTRCSGIEGNQQITIPILGNELIGAYVTYYNYSASTPLNISSCDAYLYGFGDGSFVDSAVVSIPRYQHGSNIGSDLCPTAVRTMMNGQGYRKDVTSVLNSKMALARAANCKTCLIHMTIATGAGCSWVCKFELIYRRI